MEIEGEPPELPDLRVPRSHVRRPNSGCQWSQTARAKERAVAEKHRIAQAKRCFDRQIKGCALRSLLAATPCDQASERDA